MIDISKTVGAKDTFDPKLIKSYAEKQQVTSIATLEKAILCLEYLGQLNNEGLDLIFKGGSAVQIILKKDWTRLSVDIDICTNSTKEEIEYILEKIHTKFNKEYFSYEERRPSFQGGIPFYSYRIETPAITDTNRTILLDIIGETPKTPTTWIPLRTSYFQSSNKIKILTKGALLGDKLSTIGPTTIGRKLTDRRNGIEYAKHLFDINNLLKSDYKFEECVFAYNDAINNQSKFRKNNYQIDECVSDMVFTCQVASLPESIGQEMIDVSPTENRVRANSEFRILSEGLRGIRPFLGQKVTYTNEELRRYATQAALIATLICKKEKETTVNKHLNSGFPTDRKDITELVKDIEKLPKKERWFINSEEIQNFPEILKLWHSYFELKGMLTN